MKKLDNVKHFIKDHKCEIILGTGLVITVVSVCYLKHNMKEIIEMALESLRREERRIIFEIEELRESIERLKPDAPINKYDKIPRRLARIEELEAELKRVRETIAKVLAKRP
jgi:hypothetical protein